MALMQILRRLFQNNGVGPILNRDIVPLPNVAAPLFWLDNTLNLDTAGLGGGVGANPFDATLINTFNNTGLKPGVYFARAGTPGAPTSSGNFHIMVRHATNADGVLFIIQQAVNFSANTTYQRSFSVSTWSAWNDASGGSGTLGSSSGIGQITTPVLVRSGPVFFRNEIAGFYAHKWTPFYYGPPSGSGNWWCFGPYNPEASPNEPPYTGDLPAGADKNEAFVYTQQTRTLSGGTAMFHLNSKSQAIGSRPEQVPNPPALPNTVQQGFCVRIS